MNYARRDQDSLIQTPRSRRRSSVIAARGTQKRCAPSPPDHPEVCKQLQPNPPSVPQRSHTRRRPYSSFRPTNAHRRRPKRAPVSTDPQDEHKPERRTTPGPATRRRSQKSEQCEAAPRNPFKLPKPVAAQFLSSSCSSPLMCATQPMLNKHTQITHVCLLRRTPQKEGNPAWHSRSRTWRNGEPSWTPDAPFSADSHPSCRGSATH